MLSSVLVRLLYVCSSRIRTGQHNVRNLSDDPQPERNRTVFSIWLQLNAHIYSYHSVGVLFEMVSDTLDYVRDVTDKEDLL